MVPSPLTEEERAACLPALFQSGWTPVEGRDALTKTFVFQDFNEAFGFMSRVALKAEEKKDTIRSGSMCGTGLR